MQKKTFFDRIKQSLREVAEGEQHKQEKPFQKQLREAQLLEIQNSLIVLTANVIKASKAFPSQTEQFIVNYFNQHFGFVYSKKRMEQLQNHLSVNTSSYTKISCTQLKSLATEDSIDEMIRFLIDVAVSDDFINAKEIKVLQQIGKYLGVPNAIMESYLNMAKDSSNPYVLLEIEEGASAKEILAAYRKMVLKYHPDKCKLPLSKDAINQKFYAVKRAYELVKDKSLNDIP
jgi:DnaJ like chaperone protein